MRRLLVTLVDMCIVGWLWEGKPCDILQAFLSFRREDPLVKPVPQESLVVALSVIFLPCGMDEHWRDPHLD